VIDNTAAIASWRLWMRVAHGLSGDVTPRDGDGAVFAETGAGGVLAVTHEGVVLVHADGTRRVIAEDVPHALAVIAACGHVAIEDVLDGTEPGPPEEGFVAWLWSTFGVAPPPSAIPGDERS
jgi:hypothetical protein